MTPLAAPDAALLDLLKALEAADYAFVTPTPETHARNLGRRRGERAKTLRDVFGWSLPFGDDAPAPPMRGWLETAGAIERTPDGDRSAVRVSACRSRLFLHSAYPTDSEDAVFFGPDSYRFADLIAHELKGACPRRIVDVGSGSGVGAMAAADVCRTARIVISDVNEAALRLARVNAAAAGVEAEIVQGDGVRAIEGDFDLALLNPPYILDEAERQYRHGGAMHGAELALDLSQSIVERLAPGGRLILYTGSAIVDGRDALRAALHDRLPGCDIAYRELDPDVFGEELDRPAYRDVERISAVAAIIAKR